MLLTSVNTQVQSVRRTLQLPVSKSIYLLLIFSLSLISCVLVLQPIHNSVSRSNTSATSEQGNHLRFIITTAGLHPVRRLYVTLAHCLPLLFFTLFAASSPLIFYLRIQQYSLLYDSPFSSFFLQGSRGFTGASQGPHAGRTSTSYYQVLPTIVLPLFGFSSSIQGEKIANSICIDNSYLTSLLLVSNHA